MRRNGFPRPILGLVTAVALGALAACDSPSPRFMRATQQSVEVGGSTFSVHRLGDEVEVYRTSVELMPSRVETLAKAEIAIERATGCRVKPGSLTGDPALMMALLVCA